MSRFKFNDVNNALIEKTRGTSNWVRLSKNVDCRHKGNYVLENVITKNKSSFSYKTLSEVVEEFNLEVGND